MEDSTLSHVLELIHRSKSMLGKVHAFFSLMQTRPTLFSSCMLMTHTRVQLSPTVLDVRENPEGYSVYQYTQGKRRPTVNFNAQPSASSLEERALDEATQSTCHKEAEGNRKRERGGGRGREGGSRLKRYFPKAFISFV